MFIYPDKCCKLKGYFSYVYVVAS